MSTSTSVRSVPASAAVAGPIHPKRRRLYRAVTLSGVLLVSLAFCEVALRVRERLLLATEGPRTWAGDYDAYLKASHSGDRMFLRDPSDVVVPYRNRPGFRHEFALPSGQEWRCTINALGFRGPEFTIAKPAGVRRVLCVGGSTTFWGYRDGLTYPAMLSRRLNANGASPIEVLNLGVSGYTSAMNAERFHREYRGFSPDVVVLYEGVNDICDLAPARYRHRIARSLLLATVSNLATGWCEGGEGAHLATIVAQSFKTRVAPQLDRILEETRQVGARLLISTFPGPDLSRLSADERRFLDAELYRSWRELGSLESYAAALSAYNQKVREWAAAHAVAVIDLERAVQGTTDLFMDICHLHTNGLERVAEAAAEAITAAEALPN